MEWAMLLSCVGLGEAVELQLLNARGEPDRG
jgi:hypothetical protein